MFPQLIDTFITSAGQQIENIVCAAASLISKSGKRGGRLEDQCSDLRRSAVDQVCEILEVATKEADAGTVADAVHTLSQDGDDVFKRLREFVAGQTC